MRKAMSPLIPLCKILRLSPSILHQRCIGLIHRVRRPERLHVKLRLFLQVHPKQPKGLRDSLG